MNKQASTAILRPGAEEWELWRFPVKAAPSVIANPSKRAIASASPVLMALASRDVLAVPLWVSSAGIAQELAEMELSGRHLLRRGASVASVRIAESQGRALLLALAANDESSASDSFSLVKDYEVSARLWDAGTKDLLIWRELGKICYGFYREGQCVFFAATGESSLSKEITSALMRVASRLVAEQVLTREPLSLRLVGLFPPEERRDLATRLSAAVEYMEAIPGPQQPAQPSDVAPPTARRAREKRASRRQWVVAGFVTASLYAIVLAAVGAWVLWQELDRKHLREESARLAPQAKAAQQDIETWRELRAAMDPQAFALDQLAAVAALISSDQMRITVFSLDPERLTISGEAADISQAFAFFEQIKVSPALADYDWTSRQPELAGKSQVRFEIEGTRPDAKPREE